VDQRLAAEQAQVTSTTDRENGLFPSCANTAADLGPPDVVVDSSFLSTQKSVSVGAARGRRRRASSFWDWLAVSGVVVGTGWFFAGGVARLVS